MNVAAARVKFVRKAWLDQLEAFAQVSCSFLECIQVRAVEDEKASLSLQCAQWSIRSLRREQRRVQAVSRSISRLQRFVCGTDAFTHPAGATGCEADRRQSCLTPQTES